MNIICSIASSVFCGIFRGSGGSSYQFASMCSFRCGGVSVDSDCDSSDVWSTVNWSVSVLVSFGGIDSVSGVLFVLCWGWRWGDLYFFLLCVTWVFLWYFFNLWL